MKRRVLLIASAVMALGLSFGAALAQPTEAQLMAPGPLPENSFGAADAPVTIVEYASMTCPHCRSFHMSVWPELKARYVDNGKLRFIIREFPFDPRASGAFMLARCAGQDKWYATVDLLFRAQDNWARAADATAAFKQLMGMTGMDGAKVESCLSDQALLDKVNAVAERGRSFGVEATPSFFVNGEAYKGDYSVEALGSRIDALLAAKQ